MALLSFNSKLSKLSLLVIIFCLVRLIKPKNEAFLAEKLDISINPKTITVSGLSSGGYMPGQFHLAHSAHIKGVAIFSAGPYFCSQGKVEKASTDCMANPENLDIAYLQGIAEQHEKLGLLDSLENLKNSKVFISIGLKDTRVLPGVSEKMLNFYEILQVTKIKTNILAESEHAYPTDNKANNPCGNLGSPFINYCGFPGALNALKFIGNPETFTKENKVLKYELDKIQEETENNEIIN